MKGSLRKKRVLPERIFSVESSGISRFIGARPLFTVFLFVSTVNSLLLQPLEANDLIADTATLKQVRKGIDNIYNYEFEAASETLELLREDYPEHPVTPFFEGLITYWKHYPLIPGREGGYAFERAMEESSEDARPMKKSESNIEGVFFDLMSRSFLVMYHADNGNSAKAIPHLPVIYRDIIKGMEMKEEFSEFYFMTGLYNYYREAFPDAYPIYKPAAFFFRRGDRDKGLQQLRQSAMGQDFTSVEASLFLSLIWMNFESNADSAEYYAGRLYREYPQNSFFLSKYAEMLVLNERYDTAIHYIDQLSARDEYSRVKARIFRGMVEQEHNHDSEKARQYYEEGIRMAEPFGERANYSLAYAYVGLSRYYEKNGEEKKAKTYMKKARHATGYEYVFER